MSESVRLGERLILRNVANRKEQGCRVVYLGERQDGGTEVGLCFMLPKRRATVLGPSAHTPRLEVGLSLRVRQAIKTLFAVRYISTDISLPRQWLALSGVELHWRANYLPRPLQLLNLNDPIRVDQLKLPVVA